MIMLIKETYALENNEFELLISSLILKMRRYLLYKNDKKYRLFFEHHGLVSLLIRKHKRQKSAKILPKKSKLSNLRRPVLVIGNSRRKLMSANKRTMYLVVTMQQLPTFTESLPTTPIGRL